MTTKKHLWTNGTDTFIAESAEQAMREWEYHTSDVDMSQVWEMIPDDRQFTVYFEDEIKPEYLPAQRVTEPVDPEREWASYLPWTHSITALAGDWANCNWKDAFLCSTEY